MAQEGVAGAGGVADAAVSIHRHPADELRGLRARADALAAEWIGNVLNDHLAAAPLDGDRLEYSEAARRLLVRAWTLAAHLQSRQVDLEHMIAALATDDASVGHALDTVASGESTFPLAGALVRIASLHVVEGRQTIEALRPGESVVRWFREAGRLAALRDAESRQLLPDDLVAAMRHSACDASVRRKVRAAVKDCARVGRTQSELVRARRGIGSLGRTVRHFRSDTTESLGRIQGGLTGLDDKLNELAAAPPRAQQSQPTGPAAEPTALGARVDGGVVPGAGDAGGTDGARDGAEVAAIRRLVEDCREQLTQIRARLPPGRDPQLAELITLTRDCRSRLAGLDRRTIDAGAVLPRPPSGLRVLLAVAGVLVLGATAGMALSGGSELLGQIAATALR